MLEIAKKSAKEKINLIEKMLEDIAKEELETYSAMIAFCFNSQRQPDKSCISTTE